LVSVIEKSGAGLPVCAAASAAGICTTLAAAVAPRAASALRRVSDIIKGSLKWRAGMAHAKTSGRRRTGERGRNQMPVTPKPLKSKPLK
jgi:hypothetical protein